MIEKIKKTFLKEAPMRNNLKEYAPWLQKAILTMVEAGDFSGIHAGSLFLKDDFIGWMHMMGEYNPNPGEVLNFCTNLLRILEKNGNEESASLEKELIEAVEKSEIELGIREAIEITTYPDPPERLKITDYSVSRQGEEIPTTHEEYGPWIREKIILTISQGDFGGVSPQGKTVLDDLETWVYRIRPNPEDEEVRKFCNEILAAIPGEVEDNQVGWMMTLKNGIEDMLGDIN